MSEWESIEAADARVGDLISWSMNKPILDHGYHCGTVLKICRENGGERIVVTCNDGIHVYHPDSQLWRKGPTMASDSHGMPMPRYAHGPFRLIPNDGISHQETHLIVDGENNAICPISHPDVGDFFAFAANNIIQCREVVRRLAEWSKGGGYWDDWDNIAVDAARLWAKMQEDYDHA